MAIMQEVTSTAPTRQQKRAIAQAKERRKKVNRKPGARTAAMAKKLTPAQLAEKKQSAKSKAKRQKRQAQQQPTQEPVNQLPISVIKLPEEPSKKYPSFKSITKMKKPKP